MSERMTASRHLPLYVQRPDHSRQKVSVAANEARGSRASGIGRSEGAQLTANVTVSPCFIRNRAVTRDAVVFTSTDDRRCKASGPAMMLMTPSWCLIHGMELP